MQSPKISAFGQQAVLVEWASKISLPINQQVLQFDTWVNRQFEHAIIETVPAYQSLAIYLNSEVETNSFITQLQENQLVFETPELHQNTVWKIPVCYAPQYALDLSEVATVAGLKSSEVIELHSASTYHIYFTGFLPGFIYLGGLSEKLQVPRRAVPRLQVNRGAVGIGGNQTGVYPQASPGGWQIIGQTPLAFFNVDRSPPVAFKAGDKVRFVPISTAEYLAIEIEVARGSFQVEKIEEA